MLLKLWPLTRRWAGSGDAWPEVWRRRAEWAGGWPEAAE